MMESDEGEFSIFYPNTSTPPVPMARCRWYLLLSVAAHAAVAVSTVPRLRAAEIKRRLTRFSVDTSGIFEKEELLSLLTSRIPEAAGAGHAVPLVQVGAMQGAMGAGVSVDSTKCYWALRLELPQVQSPDSATQMRFVIDSAATNSLVSPAAASALGAKSTGVMATSDTATAATRQGGLKQVRPAAVSLIGPSLPFLSHMSHPIFPTCYAAFLVQVTFGEAFIDGGFSSGDLSPVVMDLPVDAAGLLGLDFLSRHDLELYLRPSRPCALFHRKGAANSGEIHLDDLVRVEGRRIAPSGLFALPISLRRPTGPPSPPITALLDMGSSHTVCNWSALESAGVRKGDECVREGSSVLAGAGGEP